MKRPGIAAVKVLTVVALSLLLSGCLKLNMDLTVSSDNKVSGTVIFAVNKQILQATGQTADQLLSGNPIASPSAQGVTTEPYDDGTFVGQKVTFDSAPLSEFGSAASGSDALQILREGDQFKVSGAMDLSSSTQQTGDPQMDQLIQQAMQTADIRLSITFPGGIISSNGKVDGNTVTWEPKIGARTELTAVASAKSSSSSPLILILIGAGVLVVLVVGAFAMSRRGKKGGETAPVAEPPVAEPPAVEPPAEAMPLAIEPPAGEAMPPAVEPPAGEALPPPPAAG